MKLNLDFSKYFGTNRLRHWWKEVKTHFMQLQEAHNDLDTALTNEIAAREKTDAALSSEVTNRTNADIALQQKITAETNARANADTILQQNIDTETSSRQNADTVLDNKISDEISIRESADTALDERVTVVEGKAHSHDNKNVLDGISETDIEHWNGILEQVTQTQLDAVKAYFEDLCFGFANEFKSLWNAIGMTVYDGGIFGQTQTDISLDGGDFTDEIIGEFDCGGFEPYRVTAEIGAVVDGGSY